MIALVLAVALGGRALAAWQVGDFETYGQGVWGEVPSGTNIGGLLTSRFGDVYAGLMEVGLPGAAGFSMLFTNGTVVNQFLPAQGTMGPLTADLINPSVSMSGVFGGGVVALQLNVDFADASILKRGLGIAFGDLILREQEFQPFNGLSVREFLAEMNTVLGGGSVSFSPSIIDLNDIITDLNSSFAEGHISDWSNTHLRLPGPSTDGAFITYPQLSWGQPPHAANGAGLLTANFDAVYGGSFFVGRGGIVGQSMRFTSAAALLAYLPASGNDGRLLSSYVNPTSTNAGGFGGEVAALKLNIDFADAGLLGDSAVAFGDLVLYGLTLPNQTEFNGQTVRQFYADANFSIGTPVVADVSHFNAVAEALNAAFAYGYLSDWAEAHLRIPQLSGDYNGNGVVDAADYTVWRDQLNQSFNLPGERPDAATPGVVDAEDYDFWKSRFGQSHGSGGLSFSAGETAVPEPGAALLLLLAVFLWPHARDSQKSR